MATRAVQKSERPALQRRERPSGAGNRKGICSQELPDCSRMRCRNLLWLRKIPRRFGMPTTPARAILGTRRALLSTPRAILGAQRIVYGPTGGRVGPTG